MLAQHRHGDPKAQRRAIDETPCDPVEQGPRAVEEIVVVVSNEMIVEVAERGGSQDGQGDPHRSRAPTGCHEHGKKEELYEYLLEVVVVSIPELEDRCREKWFVGIPEDAKSSQPESADDEVAADGDR